MLAYVRNYIFVLALRANSPVSIFTHSHAKLKIAIDLRSFIHSGKLIFCMCILVTLRIHAQCNKTFSQLKVKMLVMVNLVYSEECINHTFFILGFPDFKWWFSHLNSTIFSIFLSSPKIYILHQVPKYVEIGEFHKQIISKEQSKPKWVSAIFQSYHKFHIEPKMEPSGVGWWTSIWAFANERSHLCGIRGSC